MHMHNVISYSVGGTRCIVVFKRNFPHLSQPILSIIKGHNFRRHPSGALRQRSSTFTASHLEAGVVSRDRHCYRIEQAALSAEPISCNYSLQLDSRRTAHWARQELLHHT